MLKARGQSVLVIDKNVGNLAHMPTGTTSSARAARCGAARRTIDHAEPDLAPVSGD
jgi:hypothetical protein